MDRPSITRATSADALGIAGTEVRSWRWAYASILPADVLAALDVDERSAKWTKRLESENEDVTFVAKQDAKIVGFCLVGPQRGRIRGEVFAIYVDPDVVGTGVGAALLREGVSVLDFRTVVIWALAENARAGRFYERNGFTADGAEKLVDTRGIEVLVKRFSKTNPLITPGVRPRPWIPRGPARHVGPPGADG